MNRLKIAIQKSGRLSEKSLQLFQDCDIRISHSDRKLMASAQNFPLEILFLRDDDIPQYVEQGVADLGILGENEVLEKAKRVAVIEKLGFAHCKLSLAIPKDEPYTGLGYFEGKRIATSYPRILSQFFEQNQISVSIEEIGGSVEIATGIGLSDAIFDIVSSGSTLLMNGLKEVEPVLRSQAVLIAHEPLSPEKQELTDQLLFRLRAVKNAQQFKYILLNTPNESIEAICRILPGVKSPTVLPLADQGWSSLHSVVRDDEFWDVIGQLKQLGAQGILAFPVEKMIL